MRLYPRGRLERQRYDPRDRRVRGVRLGRPPLDRAAGVPGGHATGLRARHAVRGGCIQALRQAVAAFDFANGGPAAVRRALAAARSEDAVSLWHLLERVDPSLRRAVYDRLASLVPPPAGVTSEGALRLDRTTLDTYWNTIRRIAWRRIILRGVRDIDPRTGVSR